jgi:protein SCO1/2
MRARARACLTAVSFVLFAATTEAIAQGPNTGADARKDVGNAEAQYHGGVITPPLPKPQFTLTDTSGARFNFRSKTDGYVTLLFFGYTHCPDVCPMQMYYLSKALKKMPKEVADRFRVVFVTTDPDRDNPDRLRQWLDQFHNNFVGLTGSDAEIRIAEQAANVPPGKGKPSYDHSAFVIAYTTDNLAHVIYPYGIGEEDWLHDLPQLARETWTAAR